MEQVTSYKDGVTYQKLVKLGYHLPSITCGGASPIEGKCIASEVP